MTQERGGHANELVCQDAEKKPNSCMIVPGQPFVTDDESSYENEKCGQIECAQDGLCEA